MKTYLSKDQMLDAENDEEAVVYVALKMMFDKMLTRNTKDEVELNLNIKQLYYQLSGNYNIGRYDKPKLEKGLQGLLDAKVIELIDTDGKDEYAVNILPLRIRSKKDGDECDEPYTMMDKEEIHAIFNLPCKNRYGLLKFSIGLFGTFNATTKCGFCSIRNMPEFTGVTRLASCQEFFKLLEDNKIIYVRHSQQTKRDTNGQIKKISNVYGRPENSQEIDYFFEERILRLAHNFANTMSPARKTKMTRGYNKFVAGSFEGDVIELIQECMAYNKLPFVEGVEDKEKDLSVFSPEDIAKAKAGIKDHIKKKKAEDKKMAKAKEGSKNQAYDYEDEDFDELPY